MTKKRFAAIAAVLALAGSLSAQQPSTRPAAPNAAPVPATPMGTPSVQTVPGAMSMVDADQLGPIENAGTVRIRAGSGTVVTMQAGITRVAVGDEKLLAVHVLEPREVLLQGLTAGRSTLFVWLTDRRRLRYDVIVTPKIDVLRSSLRDLDPGIEAELSADGAAIVLRGDVASERVAKEAERITATVVGNADSTGVRIVNLLRFPAATTESEQALTAAVESVDPRIRIRRIKIPTAAEGAPADAVVLEGRVKNLTALVRAITIADLEMGGNGSSIEPVANEGDRINRNNLSVGGIGNTGGGSGVLGRNGVQQGTLATFIARGLVLRSGSGKVLSFLSVDELPQIMVSIRALQIDRGKARQLGIDYRLDAKHVSIGSFNSPGATILPTQRSGATPVGGQAGILAGAGNILASFVDQTVAITAAIDLLEQKTVARSVAEPNITTLSGEQASVLVGGEVPIPTTTVGQVTAVQGFLFQSFGVRLDIRPTLNENGMIALELSPSIIKPSADLAVGGVPGFEVQTVQTQAKVAPGQSLVIGGLLSFDDTVEKRGVPGLSEIPVLKHLFSWNGKTSSEKELIFVITPRVVSEAVVDRPLDEAAWSNVEPLPYGKAPVLPSQNSRDFKSYTPAPPPSRKPNSLPPDFPLAPTVVPQPDVVIQQQGAAVIMAPNAPVAVAVAPEVVPASVPMAEAPRPAPQAPKTELPPPPSPSNP